MKRTIPPPDDEAEQADETLPAKKFRGRPPDDEPDLIDEAPPGKKLRSSPKRSRAPPGVRLLDRVEVCGIANVTYPTIWAWMRAGTFPRSRIVGGKSMWLSSEIEGWLAALPVRKLKGDEPSDSEAV